MAKTNRQGDVDKGAKREKYLRANELAAVRAVMGSPAGRAWAWRIIERSGANDGVAFTPNAMVLAEQVGIQSLGHAILAEIRLACPETELVMRREAADRLARLEAELENEAPDDDH